MTVLNQSVILIITHRKYLHLAHEITEMRDVAATKLIPIVLSVKNIGGFCINRFIQK